MALLAPPPPGDRIEIGLSDGPPRLGNRIELAPPSDGPPRLGDRIEIGLSDAPPRLGDRIVMAPPSDGPPRLGDRIEIGLSDAPPRLGDRIVMAPPSDGPPRLRSPPRFSSPPRRSGRIVKPPPRLGDRIVKGLPRLPPGTPFRFPSDRPIPPRYEHPRLRGKFTPDPTAYLRLPFTYDVSALCTEPNSDFPTSYSSPGGLGLIPLNDDRIVKPQWDLWDQGLKSPLDVVSIPGQQEECQPFPRLRLSRVGSTFHG